MRLRSHRRSLVVWRQSGGAADPEPGGAVGPAGAPPYTRARRIRRRIRIGVLLTVISLLPVARAVRARWRPLLAGVVLTVAGLVLRDSPAGVVLLPGLLFLLSAPLIPGIPEEDRTRRAKLERELAVYSTRAQRHDLEAMLDRYPDGMTHELREILARQATAADSGGIPGVRRY